MMKFTLNTKNPPLGGAITAEYAKSVLGVPLEISWDNETTVENCNQKVQCESSNDIMRVIARSLGNGQLYGSTPIEKTEVDHWLTYAIGPLTSKTELPSALEYLNKILGPLTYLVAKQISIADFAIFSALYVNKQWQGLVSKKEAPVNVLRWYNYVKSLNAVKKTVETLPAEARAALSPPASTRQSLERTTGGRAQEGKFIDLPGAEMGKVVVRFPPEASGYLHIGHAKAALLNQYYQQAFQGKLIMRFDDTNPAKENVHFEKVILEDLEMLQIKPDRFTHTSEYFDLMLEYCEKLLKDGKAYVDDTEPEVMKQEREQRVESANRNNPYEKNLKLWNEMTKGTAIGQKCCVRAKIDMQSANGCLRDPTIYRCKNEPHPRTGDKYKVYPTYDFACPIVDAIEGVTHTLRTMEYHDRDPQFYWFIDALGLRKPHIWEYSRLSMTNTVLSKRKLTWFVESNLVTGWDDPRFPTVRGILRRGMTVEGLKQFIIAQGSSRSVVFMEWDKIWAFNKKVIDPIAPRFTAVEFESPVPVLVKGVQEQVLIVPKHPKNVEVGEKEVWVGPRLLIDRADANVLQEGENTTFINWGNLLIKKINRQNGEIVSIDAEPNLENKDYKKTLKITWLTETNKAKFTPTFCYYFDHIINKPYLGKDEDFKNFVGHQTKMCERMLGDPELKKVKKGDIIQLQRRGFFKVEQAYEPVNLASSLEGSVSLYSIPDGHTKENPITAAAAKSAGKQQVKSPTELNEEILKLEKTVLDLKARQVYQEDISNATSVLLNLKAKYKELTNSEWKHGCAPPKTVNANQVQPVNSELTPIQVNNEIIKQGDIVRNLKAQKAAKGEIDVAVKALLALKVNYEVLTSTEWKPGCVPPAATTSSGAGDRNGEELNVPITAQGDKIRKLKSEKASKEILDQEVKSLLALKLEYKQLVGKDWTPGIAQNTGFLSAINSTPTGSISNSTSTANEATVLANIAEQGDKIRELKAKKADKASIDKEVKLLLSLKADYKSLAGVEWKPGCVAAATTLKNPVPLDTTCTDSGGILERIAQQGDKIRQLKTAKAEKSIIDAEVNLLLSLKEDFKKATGKDWKPGMQPETCSVNPSLKAGGDSPKTKESLTENVNEQGELVRQLKGSGAPKNEIDAAVKKLLELKAEYKKVTGTDFPAPGKSSSKPAKAKAENATAAKDKGSKQKPPAKEKNVKDVNTEDGGPKKQTRLGLEAKKEENLSDWYSQVITKGEMIEYYDVSGCYILRPWSYAIWEAIQSWFDTEIKKLGVQNCYFPIFVSRAALEKEKTHIADFAPEVAWVTRSGDTEMAEPIAVRPTSETVMYPAYAKWIQSYRDLPIKLNQWNNVVRWEFKHPQPFLRTREFLWQEGHSAFTTREEAVEEVSTILDLYARIYTDVLAIPVVKGRKTEKEKFAGGDYTLTVEAFVSASGRAIQGATSHHLGQNFSKMFEIIFDHPETQEKTYAFQNSWGLTTRTIGVMIMIHADNQGLVLPPKAACVQLVIVPCGVTVGMSEAERNELQTSCDALESDIERGGLRVKGDYRTNYSPGWKFNHWELKGVPIRVELGPKDIKNKQLVAVRRDTGEKITIKRDAAVKDLATLLDRIQQNLYDKANEDLTSHTVILKDWSNFTPNLDSKNIILVPFCGDGACEDKIKKDSARDDSEAEAGAASMGAKSLCIPLEQPATITAEDKCIHPACKLKPKFYTLFGRSY